MKDSITASWKKKMAFEVEVAGHKIMIDATDNVGGENRGPQPKPMMLVALGGCTAMDVISILTKMRVELDDFQVKVEGDLTEEHPKHFHKMKVIYEFTGKNLPMEKLKKAISLSEERYCGVSESYRKAMELSSEIIVHES
ncbi:MAG: OsmC family protein [Bacteroidota bacterium]